MKEKCNLGYYVCYLSMTVASKTMNGNKYAAKHLNSVGFPQSWTTDIFQILFNAMTCLEKHCHVLKDNWRLPAVKRDGRTRYSYGHKAIWIYMFRSPSESSAENRLFGSQGGPPAVMQNPLCWLSSRHAKHPPGSWCLGGSGDCKAAAQLAQISSFLMHVRPLLSMEDLLLQRFAIELI